MVVVVSAMSGETNRLLALAKELSASPDPRELDVVAATGEQVTIGLLAIALQGMGFKARSYTGGQVRILTDSAFTKARILDDRRGGACARDLEAAAIVIVAGFQGVDADGNITTLGRGGSDTSAVALAAALKADECQIYTDVDGVYTTDPRIVPEARRLDKITFEEMLEMASLGSKVLQIRSVEFAGKYKVKLRVLSSFEDPESTAPGTLITYEEDENMEKAIISGIAFNRDEAKITVLGVDGPAGHRLRDPRPDRGRQHRRRHDRAEHRHFGPHRLLVHGQPQRVPEGARRAQGRARQRASRPARSSATTASPRSRSSASACARTSASPRKMFKALADEGINIQMISTSEIKISVVIDEKYLELAVRVLHQAFELEKAPA